MSDGAPVSGGDVDVTARALRRPRLEGPAGIWLIGIAVAGLVLVMSVLGELNGLVAAMHDPGHGGARVEQALTGDAADVEDQVAAWLRYSNVHTDGPGAGHTTAKTLVTWYLVLDTVAVVLVTTALLVFVRRQATRAELRRATQPGAAPPQGGPARPDDAGGDRRRERGSPLGWVQTAVVALAVVDVLVNALTFAVLLEAWPEGAPADWVQSAHGMFGVLGVVRWALLGAIVLAVGLVVTQVVGDHWREVRPVVVAARAQVAVTALLVLVFLLRLQAPDVFLGLDVVDGAVVAGLVLLYALTTWATAQNLVDLSTGEDEDPDPPQYPWQLLAGAVATLVVLAVLIHLFGGSIWGPLVPVGMLAAVWAVNAVASAVGRRPPAHEGQRPPACVGTNVLPRLLAAVAIAAFGVAVVRANAGDLFYGARPRDALVWKGSAARVVYGIAMVALALPAFALLGRLEEAVHDAKRGSGRWRRPTDLVVAVTAAATAVLLAVTVAWPFHVAPVLTAIGVVVLLLVGATVVTSALVWRAERARVKHGVPPAFRLVGFQRVPVLTLLLVWGFIGAELPDSHFDVRVRDGETVPAGPRTLSDAFDRWTEARMADAEDAGPPGTAGRTGIPLVLVASEGGGIRAAYWTALVLDCVFETHARSENDGPCATSDEEVTSQGSSIFLASGISGGSVGLVQYAAFRYRGGVRSPADEEWVRTRVGGDQLSPQLAWMLLVEGPRSFLRFPARDRAEVLEETWERRWDEDGAYNPLTRGLLATQRGDAEAEVPLLLLNGTSALDGCGVATWILDEGENREVRAGDRTMVGDCVALGHLEDGARPRGALPGVVDLDDFLCDTQDVALSTAGLLSARFPYVAPSGRLEACGAGRDGVAYVVDGGYIESSGSEPVMALWPALEREIDDFNATQAEHCIVPFFVQLDNGYAEQLLPRERRPPNQLLVPVVGYDTAGRGQRGNRARQVAAAAFSAPPDDELEATDGGEPLGGRWARIATRPHPGATAPLGWALSPSAMGDLEEQLEDNARTIARVRSWLEGDLRCAPRD